MFVFVFNEEIKVNAEGVPNVPAGGGGGAGAEVLLLRHGGRRPLRGLSTALRPQ